jgi:nitroreductase
MMATMDAAGVAQVAKDGHPNAGAVIERVLELARWAPSGDNTQPWRFEVVSDRHVVVHAFDTREDCVYDFEGRASQLSVGAMLETLRIAASCHERSVRVVRRADRPDHAPVFDVHLDVDRSIVPDPLAAVIRTRSVQRRPLATRPLAIDERARLEASVGPGYSVRWFESAAERRRLAWLAVRSAKIRLTTPEAYAVHRQIIHWDAQHSPDRVPDQALGASVLSLRSMRWAMKSWKRVSVMNRWFGGTLAPRLELDWLPGVRCAAHFAIVAPNAPKTIDDHVRAGAVVQRFWLSATVLGLQLQPQYTPLVFAAYARRAVAFTRVQAARTRASAVRRMLDAILGEAADHAVFLGRIGHGPAAAARSTRLSLDDLTWTGRLPARQAESRSSS